MVQAVHTEVCFHFLRDLNTKKVSKCMYESLNLIMIAYWLMYSLLLRIIPEWQPWVDSPGTNPEILFWANTSSEFCIHPGVSFGNDT